jgi:hypothetical protein
MRLRRLERDADRLARLYAAGFECGLRGYGVSQDIWLEGTGEMKRINEIGNVAGLRRRAMVFGLAHANQVNREGSSQLPDEVDPEVDHKFAIESARRVLARGGFTVEDVCRMYCVEPHELTVRETADGGGKA